MTDRDTGLARVLGYEFSDPSLLRQALTHRSAGRYNNERLEFLGDSVLSLVVAQELFVRYPDLPEGELSRLRSQLVCGEALTSRARVLGLGNHLVLGEGENRAGGHDRDSILADALEAVFGAVFKDGGFTAVQKVILHVYAILFSALDPGRVEKDPKTRLQEFLQKRGLAVPLYETIEVSGESHRLRFIVECHVSGSAEPTRGEGTSRRQAEQDAAAKACLRLGAS